MAGRAPLAPSPGGQVNPGIGKLVRRTTICYRAHTKPHVGLLLVIFVLRYQIANNERGGGLGGEVYRTDSDSNARTEEA